MNKYFYSALVLIIGWVFTIFIGGSLGGGDGTVSSGVFNSAMAGLIFAIIFLSATIMLCTLLILEELKKR